MSPQNALNETQKAELWKGVKILFWGGVSYAFVLFLKWIGADLSGVSEHLTALAMNAILFVGWRFFTRGQKLP